MATNCLITKLKGATNNSSLPVFNEIKLKVGNAASQTGNNSIVLRALSGKTCVIRVDGSGSFGTTNGTYIYNSSNPYTLTGGSLVTLYFAAGDYNIFISDKLNLDIIRIDGGSNPSTISVDLEEISYLTELAQLRLLNTISTGNISVISTYGNKLQGLRLSSPYIAGNVNSLGVNTALHELYLTGSGVSGSLEGFVAAQYAAGRTSEETIPMEISSSTAHNLTFGGEYRSLGGSCHLTWESATKIALFNNAPSSATKVFYSGYTEQEAAAKWPSISERTKVD